MKTADIRMYKTEKFFDIGMYCTVMGLSLISYKGLSFSCELKHHPTSCLRITALYLPIEQNMEKGKLIYFMKIITLQADHTCQNTLRILKFA